MCGVFLWQGNIESHHSARVSWENVSKPKTEGGLGIMDLTLWNKACCLKFIWLLFFQAGSVWVAWFREEVLQGNLSNLWITAPQRRFSSRFWSDNWSIHGNMRDFLQLGNTSSLGIQDMATLASLYSDGTWRLPPARSERQVEVHALLTTRSRTCCSLEQDSLEQGRCPKTQLLNLVVCSQSLPNER